MTARGIGFLLLIGLIVSVMGILFVSHEKEAPRIDGPDTVILGRSTGTVSLLVSDGRSGLRQVNVRLHHADGVVDLLSRSFPGQYFFGSGQKEVEIDVQIESGELNLEEGEAFLEISVQDWSLWTSPSGNRASLMIPVRIDLSPPGILVESGLTYIRRGGSAAVVYSIDEIVEEDGVQVGETFFRGFPLPPKALDEETSPQRVGRRFALFAIPRDAPEDVSIQVIGIDAAGNKSSSRFPARVQERDFEQVRINLPLNFLNSKILELGKTVGVEAADSIEMFRKINSERREADENRIRELVADPTSTRFWKGSFLQMRGSAVTSRFAERRSYYVSGEKISEAVHYGYDLASTAQAPVTASNSGRVVFAGNLGIYGNCILISHGLALTTLYAHLSNITVSKGDLVEKGQRIGRSGTTGLAGGDHLHFAILIGETYVDPMEWWDPRWIREHIEVRLQRAP